MRDIIIIKRKGRSKHCQMGGAENLFSLQIFWCFWMRRRKRTKRKRMKRRQRKGEDREVKRKRMRRRRLQKRIEMLQALALIRVRKTGKKFDNVVEEEEENEGGIWDKYKTLTNFSKKEKKTKERKLVIVVFVSCRSFDKAAWRSWQLHTRLFTSCCVISNYLSLKKYTYITLHKLTLREIWVGNLCSKNVEIINIMSCNGNRSIFVFSSTTSNSNPNANLKEAI